MALEIAKAGWLLRQSSFLRRWKRHWFVLYTDGWMKYFDSPDDSVAKEALLMPVALRGMQSGNEVTGVTPPPGTSKDCLITLSMQEGTWNLCAESSDDRRAWYMAVKEIHDVLRGRVNEDLPVNEAPPPYYATAYPSQPYPPVQVYPGQQTAYTYYGSHVPPYVVQAPPGQTTVVYADQPGPYYYNRRGYDGTDVAVGMVAGAALGSMMWGPLLWW